RQRGGQGTARRWQESERAPEQRHHAAHDRELKRRRRDRDDAAREGRGPEPARGWQERALDRQGARQRRRGNGPAAGAQRRVELTGCAVRWPFALAGFCVAAAAGAADLPIFDAHLHYSHDAWDLVPPRDAIAILRKAGLKRALISSSGDEGQQRLHAEAPDLVIPELRPYRSRGEVGTWFRDQSVIPYLEDRLKKYRYAGIGEFHLYGADADLPVPRRMVQLARQHNIFLHAHSDVDAIE